MRTYLTPALVEYGDVANVTGIFGGPATRDVLVDEDGNIVEVGEQSIDACAQENEVCIFPPP